ncbi:MAG: choice-of-anchor D domain-containing protein, partial [Rhodospirillales bacterium]|nr:choice-of-anchor D domain-containing protein [Rhodospirillales bacterium]
LSIDYGSVVIGTRQFGLVNIRNLGDADLTVTTLTLGGSLDFQLNNPDQEPPFTIRPGRSASIGVDYIPSDGGVDAGTLDVASDDPDEPVVQVVLSGSGAVGTPDIDVSPPSIDYGSVLVGTRQFGFVTVWNLGDGDLTVTTLTLGGSLDFQLNNPDHVPPFTIKPGRAASIGLDYIPSDSGVDAGTLDIASDDPDEPVIQVVLSGSGATGTPDIAASPPALDYGSVVVGTRQFGFVSVQNLGDADLTISGIDVQGGLDFRLNTDHTLPFVVRPGDVVSIGVDYIPSDVGTDSAPLDIVSDDPDQPILTVPLSGSGVP